MPITNRGEYRRTLAWLRGAAFPTQFYAALCIASPAPTILTKTLGQLTQIAAGNGYTDGGIALGRNSTDFPTVTENDGSSRIDWLLRNLVWMATGGTLPGSGNPARWVVITDDNGTVANREVWAYWSDGQDKVVSTGQPLTVAGAGGRITQQ